jgi:hypothetical protein
VLEGGRDVRVGRLLGLAGAGAASAYCRLPAAGCRRPAPRKEPGRAWGLCRQVLPHGSGDACLPGSIAPPPPPCHSRAHHHHHPPPCPRCTTR